MEDEANKVEQVDQVAAAAAIPEFCIRDGSIMVEGVKYGYPAWVCPSCTYWKLRAVTS